MLGRLPSGLRLHDLSASEGLPENNQNRDLQVIKILLFLVSGVAILFKSRRDWGQISSWIITLAAMYIPGASLRVALYTLGWGRVL